MDTNLLPNHAPNETLIHSLTLANDMITKSYLEKLSLGQIAPMTLEDKDISLADSAQFFQLTKLVINKKEKFSEQLINIANVVHATGGSLAVMIKSSGDSIAFYIGVLDKRNRSVNATSSIKRQATLQAFTGALQGNLTGSDLSPISTEQLLALQSALCPGDTTPTVCAISGVPAFRDGSQQELLAYAQGIEHMIDSLRGQAYTIISLADPIDSMAIAQMRQGYELIYSQLTTFLRQEVTLNETNSYTLSNTQTQSITDSITKGVALTQSRTTGDGHFSSKTTGMGVNFIAGFNLGTAQGATSSSSDTWGETKNENATRAAGTAQARTDSSGKSTGSSLQLSCENRTVKALLEKIDRHLARLDVCESFGAFSSATYVIAEERSVALAAASNFNAMLRGEGSSIQAAYINTWYKADEAKKIAEYLTYFAHPKLYLKKQYQSAFDDSLFFTPASLLTGKELTLLMAMPRQSVAGIPVLAMTPFGRNIEQKQYSASTITLGKLHHMSKDETAEVALDCNSLAAHTFITGSTGAGKSNAVYKILDEAHQRRIKFLVIEPAKGEYKHAFGHRNDVAVFGTNPAKTPLLKINPFKFPSGIHVLEHIDRLIEIFNVCWPMYAAMPAVLKAAVEQAYIAAGWDLDDSTNAYDQELFPTFADLVEQLTLVVEESAFSQEIKSNYIGALVTRVQSLTNGIHGRIFAPDEIGNAVLFDGNTIVDLSRVASMETKAMIMGILIMRLQEYRIAEGGMGRDLRHVTVLEEAHHLLKRTSTEQASEGANLLGKSVEMLANSIAEMRTYGEGFLIADQSPHMLDLSAIRNTNTKIILRLPDWADRELAGRAAGLNDEQIVELAKLPTGIAAVYQNNWLEPVLCHIGKYETHGSTYVHCGTEPSRDHTLALDIITALLGQAAQDKPEIDIDSLKARVVYSLLAVKVKSDILKALDCAGKINMEVIAPAVCGLLDIPKMLSHTGKAQTMEEWNRRLIHNANVPLGELDRKYQDLVLFCIVSERYKDTDVERLDAWLEHMGGRLC